MGVFLSLVALSLLILLHEFGHYHFAKKNGVKVEEFAIGFPPTLYSFRKNATKFMINLIPFGGYVKLFGEDSHDKKLLKDKKSFASKTPWQKTQIILAGIGVNFLIFWVLSSFAYMLGLNPIVTSEADLMNNLKNGSLSAVSVSKVVTVEEGSKAESLGYRALDKVTLNPDKSLLLDSHKVSNVNFDSLKNFGLKVDPILDLPVLTITEITDSSLFNAVLEPNDKLLKLNGKLIFDLDMLLYEFENSDVLNFEILRSGVYKNFEIKKELSNLVVSGILEGSNAELSELEVGDQILNVNGESVHSFAEFLDFNLSNANENVDVKVLRNGEFLNVELPLDENGKAGMYLATHLNFSKLGLSFYLDENPFFLKVIEKEKYPFYIAPFVALDNAWMYAKLTVKTFFNTVTDIFLKAKVSEQVGGPIKVVSMGSMVLDSGLAEFLNFIAVISLSLAVLNFLPIPALDGGRFLFILIEAITKKPVDPKFEAVLHLLGFVVLMGLIIMITIFDIIRL